MQTKVRAAAATIFSRVSARAAALDQVHAAGRLVGAVDVDLEACDRIQVEHRDAVTREAA